MNRITIVVFLSGVFLTSIIMPVFAQTGSSVKVSAQVVSAVELFTVQSMNLSRAEKENEQIRINPITSVNAGKMIALGSPNSNIRISFLETRALANQEGPETLLFHYRVAGNTIDDQATAELLDPHNRDFKFNSKGRFYIWIGGSVDLSDATPGNYEGEFTINVVYI